MSEQEKKTVKPTMASNVSIKLNDKGEQRAIVRNLDSRFCTIATVKKLGGGLMLMDFAHPDIIPTHRDSQEKEMLENEEEDSFVFHDFEFVPSASIVMPVEALELLYERMGQVLKKYKEEQDV